MRRLRDRKRLTQETLAERAGIEPRYVQQVERGKTNLTVAILVALARALSVDPRRLLRPSRPVPPRKGRPPKRR